MPQCRDSMAPESTGSVAFPASPAKISHGKDASEEQLEEHPRVLTNTMRPELVRSRFFPESAPHGDQ